MQYDFFSILFTIILRKLLNRYTAMTIHGKWMTKGTLSAFNIQVFNCGELNIHVIFHETNGNKNLSIYRRGEDNSVSVIVDSYAVEGWGIEKVNTNDTNWSHYLTRIMVWFTHLGRVKSANKPCAWSPSPRSCFPTSVRISSGQSYFSLILHRVIYARDERPHIAVGETL